jgi:PAS domain-containing protein
MERASYPRAAYALENEAARRLCGWSAEEVIGQVKCFSLLLCHYADGKLLCKGECVMQNITLNRLKDFTAQYSITLKDGREVPATVHYTSLGEPGTASKCAPLFNFISSSCTANTLPLSRCGRFGDYPQVRCHSKLTVDCSSLLSLISAFSQDRFILSVYAMAVR